MTLQTILYFLSILLTCALTGFLAWYAWRQPPSLDVRAYALLAFSECLMALTEVISTLSGTQAQALFWFNLRFLFTATIPLIFLAFALAYGGQKDWFPKRLLAGALVIPVVTQIMLWSNSLHGLWLKQEVAFHQNGPLWIADTSARIPGPWFLVHLFYSQIFMLAGMVLIFLAAWRMRRQHRGQAVLLIAGALVGLISSLIPSFNLIPQLKFNPFIPGIGFSALLYALAIFRFQFLKSVPAREGLARITNFEPHEKRSLAILVFIFILFTSGITAAAYLTYRNYEKQFRSQVEHQLSAITDLKVSGLENWRDERMADAKAIYYNPAFSALVQRCLENEDIQSCEQLQAWLDAVRNAYDYDRVFLLDTEGVEQISSPTTPEAVATFLTDEAAAIFKTQQVIFLDFHRDTPAGPIHLAILAPVYAEQDPNRPLGLLVLRIDPEIYLYPNIQRWPVPSTTAETLIARREGDDVLYLNKLRYRPDVALNMRFSLEETQLPAVKAVLGYEGIVEGLDYRGVPVIADIGAVPNSPWFIISKMDTTEVYAPLKARAWQTTLFFGMLVLVAGAGLTLVWRQQRVHYYRTQFETAESLRKSEEQYRELVEHASDGIFIADAGGNYLDVNPSGCAMLGYTRDELLSKRIIELVAPEDVAATPLRLEEMRQGKTLLTERRLICKDGSLLPVEISGRMLPDGRFQSIVRDITERKQADDAVRASEEKFRLAFDTSPDSIAITRLADGMFISVNKGFEQITGYTREQVVGKSSLEINIWKDPEDRRKVVEGLQARGEVRNFEAAFLTRAGEIVGLMSATIIELNGVRHILNITRDITERKQAEEMLEQSELRFRMAVMDAPFPIMIHAEDGKVELINKEWTNVTGYSPADIPTTADWTEKAYGNRMEMVREDIEKLYSITEKVDEGEYLITTKKGEKRNWYFSSTPLGRTPDGRRIAMSMALDITKRKQAEAERSRLWDVLDNSLNEIYIFDEKTFRFQYVNRGAQRNLGYSLDQLSTLTPLDIKPEFTEDFFRELVAPLLHRQTENIVFETVHRRADGSLYPVEVHLQLMEQGGQSQFLAVINDITERKRVGDALRNSQVKLQAIMDYSPALISIKDLDGNIILANRSFSMLDAPPLNEMIGKNVFEIFPKEVAQQLWSNDLAALQSNAPVRSEEVVKHKDGAWHTYWTVKFPIYLQSDQPFGICAISNDITERKQAEEKLTASEVRYRRLFEAARDGILILEAETGIIVDVNPFLIEMLGIPREEICGKKLWELGFFKDIAENKANFLELQLKEYIRYEDLPLETANGRRLNVEFVSNVYQVDHHRVVQCNIRDITDRKRAEQQLANYAEKLEEMVDARTSELKNAQEQLVRHERLVTLGQLAGSIGHELRNPLGVISNAIYFLKAAQPDADDRIKEYLDIIEKETHTSDKIITDLLDFTRIKSVDREPASVSELIRQTLERYPVPPSVEVTLKIAARLPQVYADPHHIIQVLGNLTVNACQAMENVGKLIISAAAQGDMIRIAVRDNGVGIPPENMSKLFEPLFTTKVKGIGLGLAVSRKLAEANGGRIEVQSEPGQGSTFTLYLPVFQEVK